MSKKATSKAPSKAVARRPVLPRPGDPLVGADGEVIADDDDHKPKRGERAQINVSSQFDPITFRPMSRRSMKELPAPPGVLNGCAAVFAYTMLGLSDREIADAVHVDPLDIQKIREHTAYAEVFNTVLSQFVSANSEILQARIAAYGHMALDRISGVAEFSKNEQNGLRAAEGLLDRGGFRPQDVLQRGAQTKNELRVVLVDGEKTVHIELNQK